MTRTRQKPASDEALGTPADNGEAAEESPTEKTEE